MSQWRRLKEKTPSDRTRDLLASVDADMPAPGARDRALAALGLGAAGIAVATTKATGALVSATTKAGAGAAASGAASGVGSSIAPPAVAKGGALLLTGVTKWAGIGILGGAVALGSVHYVATRQHERAAAAPTVSAAALPPVARGSSHWGPQQAADPVSDPTSPNPTSPNTNSPNTNPPNRNSADSPDTTRSTSGITPNSPGAAPRTRLPIAPDIPSPSVTADPVNMQLAYLSGIRDALAARDPARALRMLDDFDRRFPSSSLSEEVTVLRVDALVDAGRAAEASALAAAFLQAHPKSAYVEHVQSKIRSTK
jgi:hypothetical protein